MRISQEAQEAITNTTRQFDQVQRDLESDLIHQQDENAGLQDIIKRLQRDNLKLQVRFSDD